MKPDKKTLLIPVLVITLGTGWLLTTLEIAPGIDWIWTLGLAVVGLLTFVTSGFDKFSIVIGPLFLVASFLSVLRQCGQLRIDVEVPVLVILTGILLLVARSGAVPPPKWLLEDPDTGSGQGET